MLPQPASARGQQPTLLAIGYDADPVLKHVYRDHVVFAEPYYVIQPKDIPNSVRTILATREADEEHGARLRNLLKAKSHEAEYIVRSRSLTVLREFLEERYQIFGGPQKEKSGQDEPPLLRSKLILSPSQERLQAVSAPPGSLKEFLRQRIELPCNPSKLAVTLKPEIHRRYGAAKNTAHSICDQIEKILDEAGRDDILSDIIGPSKHSGRPPAPNQDLREVYKDLVAKYAAVMEKNLELEKENERLNQAVVAIGVERNRLSQLLARFQALAAEIKPSTR